MESFNYDISKFDKKILKYIYGKSVTEKEVVDKFTPDSSAVMETYFYKGYLNIFRGNEIYLLPDGIAFVEGLIRHDRMYFGKYILSSIINTVAIVISIIALIISLANSN